MKKITNEQLSRVYNEVIKKDGFFNIFLYRKISIQITRILAILKFSPNSVTLISFILNIFCSVLFLFGNYSFNLIALVPLNCARILDSCDGELAVLEDKKTVLGAWLDPTLDRVGDIIIFFSLVYGYYEMSNDVNIWKLFLFMLIVFCLSLQMDNINKNLGIRSSKDNLVKKVNNLSNKFKIDSKYIKWDGGFFAVLISFCVIFNAINFLLLFISLYTLLCIGINFFSSFNKFKE
ncbi:hypothetical protein AMJ49_04365 [Parcubacteria bacterium DG_74_2]|nr:MAG: hypothetical protein AMJ49_04365 [Parcubacteria bacterium DG_74_2]